MKGLLVFLFSVSAFAMPMKTQNTKPQTAQSVKPSTIRAAAKSSAKPAVVKKQIYQVKTMVSIDDVKTNDVINVYEGQKGFAKTAEQFRGGRFTEVEVTKILVGGKPTLQMDFVVGEIDAVGNKTIISTPKIIANVGEKSSIMIGSAGGRKVTVSAVAKLATLKK